MNEFNWQRLLCAWQEEVLQIYAGEQDKWIALGLPSPGDLQTRPPDTKSIEAIARAFPWIDRAVLEFYKATDGWPLWLGSFWSGIQPATDVDLFSRQFPIAYKTALESVDELEGAGGANVSGVELSGAVVLSAPDSRDFVLTLPSGASCIFSFDNIALFSNFEALMLQRMREVTAWLREMLA